MRFLAHRILLPKLRFFAIQKVEAKTNTLQLVMSIYWFIQSQPFLRDGFTEKVLEDLGYPAFVLCLLDAKARVFAIRSCKSNEPKGFKFSKPRGEQKGVVTISNKNLLDPLRAVTGEDWIPGKRYKVRGFWVADAKTMCFDLNEGVQEDFRPVTPSNDAE